MKIRADFVGCVFVDGYRLYAGDDVPAGSVVADWLLGDTAISRDELPADNGPVESTEIPVEDDEPGEKPARADSKAAWFAYAESVGATEDNATIDDYSKADLVELVG